MFRKFGNIFNYFRKEISDRMLGREIGWGNNGLDGSGVGNNWKNDGGKESSQC
jgi:hypothetical protein